MIKSKHPLKVLGDGELTVALSVFAHKFSKSAQEKITKAGGKFEVLQAMLEKLANIFRIPDLRKRILFTLGLLAVYRLGGHIPTPGVNADKLQQFFEQNHGSRWALWICFPADSYGA